MGKTKQKHTQAPLRPLSILHTTEQSLSRPSLRNVYGSFTVHISSLYDIKHNCRIVQCTITGGMSHLEPCDNFNVR
jgi:hypothetical protein